MNGFEWVNNISDYVDIFEEELNECCKENFEVEICDIEVGKGFFVKCDFLVMLVIGEVYGDIIEEEGYGLEYCIDMGDGMVFELFEFFCLFNYFCDFNCELDWFDLVFEDGSGIEFWLFVIVIIDVY